MVSTNCLFQNLEITDPEKMDRHVTSVMPITKQYGVEYVVLGGNVEVKEGDWAPGVPVIIKFPSLAAANEWYSSSEYAPLKALRSEAGRFSAVFIEDPE